MSDVMLCGVLRMPFDTQGDLHLTQLQQRCHQAADELEKRAAEIERLKEEAIVIRGANASLRLSLHGCNAFAEEQERRAETAEQRVAALEEALDSLVRAVEPDMCVEEVAAARKLLSPELKDG